MKGWRLLFVISLFSLLWSCASVPNIGREAESSPEEGVSAGQKNEPETADSEASHALTVTESAESEQGKNSVGGTIGGTEKKIGASLSAENGEAGHASTAPAFISAIPRLSGSRSENKELNEDLPIPTPPVRKSSAADVSQNGKNPTIKSESAEINGATTSPASIGPSESTESAYRDPQREDTSRSETSEAERRDTRSNKTVEAGEKPKKEETAELQEENPSQGKGDFQISAEVNENIQLSLSKKNWIYDRDKSKDLGLEFEGSRYLSDSKEFYFKAVSPGDYDLYFTSQDIETGSSSGYHVKVSVREEGAAAEDSEALELGSAGKDFDGSDGTLSLSPTGLFAEEYPTEFSNAALEAELSDRDIEGIQRQLRSLYAGFSQPPVDDEKGEPESVEWGLILSAAEELENTEYEALARSILELLLGIKGGEGPLFGDDEGKKRAQIYYLLGGIYESPQQPRDERTAVEYYRKVLEIFPATIYHFKAEDRIKYLERHFLQIR